MSIEQRAVSGFDRLRFRGPGVLNVTQGETESLTIHAPDYVLSEIASDVHDGRLTIGYGSARIIFLKVHREVISYSLTVKDLREIVVTGVGRVVAPDLDVDGLDVRLPGIGQVRLDHLTADRLDVQIKGAGSVTVRGDVESQTVEISGAGKYRAQQLVSDFARINVSGAGMADISVSEDLDVAISGAGNVTYAGYPDIVKRISGIGSLRRRRRGRRPGRQEEEHG